MDSSGDARPMSDAEREVVREARAWKRIGAFYGPFVPLIEAVDRLEKEYETEGPSS